MSEWNGGRNNEGILPWNGHKEWINGMKRKWKEWNGNGGRSTPDVPTHGLCT